MSNSSRFKSFRSICIAVLFDLLLTLISSALHINLAGSGFAHLLLVLIVAMRLGFWPASAVSVVANLGLNFFLIPPTHSFAISDPQNVLALLVFEICALIVSRLSAHAQRQFALATAHRLELEKLCSFSRELLLLDRTSEPANQILHLVNDEFATEAALLFDTDLGTAEVYSHETVLADARAAMKAAVKASLFQNQDFSNVENNFFVRVMRIGCAPVGALGLGGSRITPFLCTAIAALCAIALEREKSLVREAIRAAEQKTEELRTAVLDGLAHEYKTPLTTIQAAAGCLLEVGHISETHSELLRLIEQQTCKLDSLTARLLRTSSLDRSDVKLNLQTIDPEDLIETVVTQMRGVLSGHTVAIILEHGNSRLEGDRDLLNAALTQYLNNAAKYSNPDSTITIAAESGSHEVRMSVHNSGSYLPPSERERVFERFHRAETVSRDVPGSGVGLSVVRKVAYAHNGRAWVTSDKDVGTTFFLAMPSVEG